MKSHPRPPRRLLRSRHGHPAPLARPLRHELLEDRRLLATITVTTLADTIDLADGQTSLREAIFAANTVPGADEINFAPALFAEGGKTILLTQGELKITDSLTLTGPGRDLLTIDASGNDPTPDQNNSDGSRVLNITASTGTVSISHLSVTGGDERQAIGGGGILSTLTLSLSNVHVYDNATSLGAGGVSAPTLTLVDSHISGNSARTGTGGVRATTLTVNNSIIENNVTTLGNGGGASAERATIEHSTVANNKAGGRGGGIAALMLQITYSDITDNVAATGGGGVYASNNLLITSTTITGNVAGGAQTAADGGGILFTGRFGIGSDPPCSVQYSVVSNNRTTGPNSSGGGIHCRYGAITISGSIITNNTATASGGGVLAGTLRMLDTLILENQAAIGGGVVTRPAAQMSTSTILRSSIIGNVARDSGGGVFVPSSNESVRIQSCTISGNSAGTNGGAFTTGGSGNIQIENCTIVHNIADSDANGSGQGGGIHQPSGARIVIDHTIVGLNRLGSGAASDFFRTTTFTALFSLIGHNSGSGLAEAPLGSPDANGNLVGGPLRGVIDPLLAPLANNGGFFELPTHALLAGSPALDAGDPTAKAGGFNTPLADQRDLPYSRVIGVIDIGAIEQIPDTLIVDALDDMSDGNYSTGHLSLREAIELANSASGANTIEFAATLFADGPRTILLTNGELAITDSLTLTGPGRDLLTIDASGNDPTPDQNNGDGSRVFTIGTSLNPAHDVALAALTLKGGDYRDGAAVSALANLRATDARFVDNHAQQFGGAIYAGLGRLELVRTDFSGNSARLGGGAVYSTPLGGTTLIQASSITGNAAPVGGGVYWRGNELTIAGSLFDGNVATLTTTARSRGGAMYLRGSEATIADSIISNNSADAGGGIRSETQTLNIIRSTITGNIAGISGGGILNRIGKFTISDSSIDHNRAGTPDAIPPAEERFVGGGIAGVGPTIISTTIADNWAAERGGGLYVNAGTPSLRDSTISGNSANVGAGMYVDPTFSPRAVVTRSTITNNSAIANRGLAGVGGGVSAKLVTLAHSIVAGNTAWGNAPDLNGRGSATFSFVGNSQGTNLAEALVGHPDANGNLIGGPIYGAIDPLLGPLADNGGPTLPGGAKLLTHALLPGSPALNAGDPTLVAGIGDTPEFDERGAAFGRVIGGRIDIGAFEFQASGGALSADFDGSGGLVGGFDFLAWQRNFGRTTDATFAQGDATGDRDVDANDLAVWTVRFGSASPPPPAAESMAAAFSLASLAAALAAPSAALASTDGLLDAMIKNSHAFDLALDETASAGRGDERPVARRAFRDFAGIDAIDEHAELEGGDHNVDAALDALFAPL